MDQDGFSIAISMVAIVILASGLVTGAFAIQFFQATRKDRPIAYWACALVLVLVALEAFRRAWFIGCIDC